MDRRSSRRWSPAKLSLSSSRHLESHHVQGCATAGPAAGEEGNNRCNYCRDFSRLCALHMSGWPPVARDRRGNGRVGVLPLGVLAWGLRISRRRSAAFAALIIQSAEPIPHPSSSHPTLSPDGRRLPLVHLN
ncbi:hypothetical protein K402DRAFT_74553 [Aulographum hederae CBS 113979]|uniref:Uncharacterized protein n=1 Tax=Aulographum hederae CBS 113979 TaxID=1176131 RepID=A0A6G1HFI7_9PEZI|nr:hypothetical protein K402DRAFT_74553 [Aulographum hederae CBS 113979]